MPILIHNDGSFEDVPDKDVASHLAKGSKPTVKMLSPEDGAVWHIPADRVKEAALAGGRFADKKPGSSHVKK